MNTADRVHRMTDYVRSEVEKCRRKEWVETTAMTGRSKSPMTTSDL